MIIRKIDSSDIVSLNNLHKKTFNQDFDFNNYAEEKIFHYGILMEDNGQIIGYLVSQLVFEIGDLFYIAIDATRQGKGYGLELMNRFISDAKSMAVETISLEVRISNQAAIALYEKCGFSRAIVRKNYYSDGEDALLMVYSLNK